MSGQQDSFPSTHWSKFHDLQESADAIKRREALSFLSERYSGPVRRFFIKHKRCAPDQADELTQEFFLYCIKSDFFGKAREEKGRFRNFLSRSLSNFYNKFIRDGRAGVRNPPGGFSPAEDENVFGASGETPEELLFKEWAQEVIDRTLRALKSECEQTDKLVHYEIFRRRIVDPILDGTDAPPIGQLAGELHFTKKEVENRLITARRAFQRLLRVDLRVEASSREEEAAELQRIMSYLRSY